MATGLLKFDVRRTLLLAGYVAFVVVLLFVFVKGWVEVGEERFWIFSFLVTVPLFMAILVALSFSVRTWMVRALLGIATLIVTPVLLIQTALLADTIYENPAGFPLIVPVILEAEVLYLAVFPMPDPRDEAWRRERRKRVASAAGIKE
jgi:hypothetical protein